jgi:hypothetical protein
VIVFASWKSGKSSSEHVVDNFWQHSFTLSIMILYRTFEIFGAMNYSKDSSEYARSLKIFKQLADGGYLENNRQLVASYFRYDDIPHLLEGTFSMKQLQKLNLWIRDLKLEQLSRVFWSCPELTELHLTCRELRVSEKLETDEQLIKMLRQGFQRLRHCELDCEINGDSWLVIQEMLT